MQPRLTNGTPRTQLIALLVVMFALGPPTLASPHDHEHGHDHNRARAALGRGEIRPLAEVLDMVTASIPGDVVEVELEREDGAWVYEFKIIATGGRRIEVVVDAATGVLLEHEEDD